MNDKQKQRWEAFQNTVMTFEQFKEWEREQGYYCDGKHKNLKDIFECKDCVKFFPEDIKVRCGFCDAKFTISATELVANHRCV